MRYLALATDYDGTLAHHGQVEPPTIAALERFRETGRRLVLVTGRELNELLGVFPRIDLFDRVVAENGALLYHPETRAAKTLGERPPDAFVAALKARGVAPIAVGRVIVATWEPHQSAVLEVIHELGLELHVIFNKGAVMVLPSGVNKATGLTAALDELGLSPHNTVGVGDAENDHAFLAACECAVAVANALPTLQDRADLVTAASHGAGVVELIDCLIAHDLRDLAPRLTRHAIPLGRGADDTEERVDPAASNILIAGTSGSGKSTITTGLLERLGGAGYQYAIIDPEGDYSRLDGPVVVGNPRQPPDPVEVLDLLSRPRANVVVNLLGIALEHRPGFFQGLLPRLLELRARTGRPHWIVIDEAHHLLPSAWEPAPATLPQELSGLLLITVHPASLARGILEAIDLLLAVGRAPSETIAEFREAIGQRPPATHLAELGRGEALAWWLRSDAGPRLIRTEPPRAELSRHSRKYAEGNLDPPRHFHFRGPENKLDLRAPNLVLFLLMAEGVDDSTWRYHLRRGDYSDWFREAIKDDDLAHEAVRIERAQADAPAAQSRAAIRAAIERRYTLPAEKVSGAISND